MPFNVPSAYLDDDGVTAVVWDPTDKFQAVRPAGGAWKECSFTVGDFAELNLVKDAKAAAALLAEARAALDRPTGKVLSGAPRWFYWGDTLAVLDGADAWSVGANGWLSVNATEVMREGMEFTEAEARASFNDDFETFREPPISSAQAVTAALLAEGRAALDRRFAGVTPLFAFCGPTMAAKIGMPTPFVIKRMIGYRALPKMSDLTAAEYNVIYCVSHEELWKMIRGALRDWDTSRRLA